MDNDTNLAAWMIGRGQRTPDPADVRDLVHRQALATVRGHGQASGIASRVASAVLSALRRQPAPGPQAGCPV
jgi:hypothetical protein